MKMMTLLASFRALIPLSADFAGILHSNYFLRDEFFPSEAHLSLLHEIWLLIGGGSVNFKYILNINICEGFLDYYLVT